MTRFFFKINLNKFGELRLQQEAERKAFQTFVSLFVLGTILLFAVVIYLNTQLAHKLDAREHFLKQIEDQVATYEVSGDFLSKSDLDRLSDAFTDRIFWARKLVALADRTQNQIAITHFSYKRGILSLYGITKVNKNEKEFDLINNFIESLKANPQISADFKDIEFIRSNRDREKDTDIIRFQVDCFGKDSITQQAKAGKK
ncbi:MAG TPA: hypothetical protein PLE74_00230 [Candidatus Cloacimonadota bacterium]|nr:hypothetical protein [Candidatus Cloacimonadota bacterium]HPT70686.1 hypothetical protein [Candidatus Cloacimonadota bacterium]